MRRISDLPDGEAAAELRACCASPRWVERMLSQRPFKDADEVFESAERIWWDLAPAEWLLAFAAHPRIGEMSVGELERSRGGELAASEQSLMHAATDEVKARMAQANRDYEAKFGWIYLVCATGKSAEEMLALAQERMAHDPATELRAAATEQAKITRLRLVKLLAVGS